MLGNHADLDDMMKRSRKNSLSIAAMLLAQVLLSGCGKNATPGAPGAPGTEASTATAEPAAAAPDDGKRWIQKFEIKVGAKADLRNCVTDGIKDLPQFAMDADAGEPGTVLLKTALAKSMLGLIVSVSRNDHGGADIQYVGHGFREPDEARQMISPELRKLADALTAACK